MGDVIDLSRKPDGRTSLSSATAKRAHVFATDPVDIPNMWALDLDQLTVEYQPGNGSRYPLVIQRMNEPEVYENWGGPWLVAYAHTGGLGGCTVVGGSYFDASFVAEQLGLRSIEDASRITEVLNAALGEGPLGRTP